MTKAAGAGSGVWARAVLEPAGEGVQRKGVRAVCLGRARNAGEGGGSEGGSGAGGGLGGGEGGEGEGNDDEGGSVEGGGVEGRRCWMPCWMGSPAASMAAV